MTPEEEFDHAQAEGRTRRRMKAYFRMTAVIAGAIAFLSVFVPLVMLEARVITLIPALGGLGRFLLLLFGAIAAAFARLVYGLAGGKRLREIEAWERARDDW